MKCEIEQSVVCVVGLGYVGLPLAEAFAEKLTVIGFDTDVAKTNRLREHHLADVGQQSATISFTSDPVEICKADFVAICVPTPVTKSKDPDLSYVKGAAVLVGQNLKRGCVVILESTVYPGVTEEEMKPILERESGLKCGRDFKIAYSPERINPGDDEHSLGRMTKVVAGMDIETSEIVAALYNKIAGEVFVATDIRTAEAAKVIENIQRDLNIALMNELSLIFERMGINTEDVIEAAGTKWNFHKYSPGLIGGHCIPVDPYYLVYRAKALDYHPQVILAGRAINDFMPKHVAELTIKALNHVKKVIRGSRILVMGLTYKENVADIRETPVKRLIKELQEYGVDVEGCDPLVSDCEDEFGIRIMPNFGEVPRVDGVILTAVHDAFRGINLDELKQAMNSDPILIDVRGHFDSAEALKQGFCYRRL